MSFNIEILGSGSDGNCYIVSDGKTNIMLDCGIKFKDIQRKCNYSLDVKACLVSHQHSDHVLSVKDIIQNGIELYLSPETADFLKLESYECNRVDVKKQFTVGTFEVISFDLKHFNNDGSDCRNYGYLLCSRETKDKLLYVTDTPYIHNQFKGITHLMIETNYTHSEFTADDVANVEKRRFSSHMSLDTAVGFIKSTDTSQLKEVYAIHLSKGKADRERIRTALKDVCSKDVEIKIT